MVGGRRHLVDILRLDCPGRHGSRLRRSLRRSAPVPRAGGRRRSALPVDRRIRGRGRGRGWRRRGTLTASAGREQRRRRSQPQEQRGREQGTQHAVPAGSDQRRTERPARAAPTPLDAGQGLMGPERMTASARPRGHAAALASNDPTASSVNPRSALCSRQRAACTVAARSGRRYRFVVMRLVLSWRPGARARLDRETMGSPPPRSSVHQLQASPAPRSRPVPGPARGPDM